uniref:Si:dkeyp-72g9.4 n=1 Tax=Astyanax mexicanus TaxID=7994 RepID=W5LSH6_ASTMX
MRPRSRLLAKRGLPTIREGYEELVQDLNQTNSQHTSTQDYFHSICQLARPTFPLHEPDRDILSLGTLDSPKPCLRLHRLRQPLSLQLQLPLAMSSSIPTSSQQPSAHREKAEQEQAHGLEQGGPEHPGSADPLEYLYSHGGATASSTRRGRPGPDSQRKSSCPELLGLAEPVPSPTVLQRSPVSRKKLDDGVRSSIPAKLDGTPAGWRGKSSSRCMDRQTMVSHWIAECRSAWREARIRACMLPAIAEK